MKKYIVEFTLVDGTKEEVEFLTDRLQWTIDQWCRNRAVKDTIIKEESESNNSKRILLG